MSSSNGCVTDIEEESSQENATDLEEDLRRSAFINSTPIKSGIGMKDFIQLIREGIASKKSAKAKRER